MARSKPSALQALAKLKMEREDLTRREQQLRAEAASELGKLLLDCGAESLEPVKLKQLVQRSMALGIDGALQRLSAS